MNQQPVITIIIPVYNIAPYLNLCIQSVLGQTFSDFELILTDDGSTDASGTLCDQWASADSRIRVIHKAHEGTSAARNAGINCARGAYIGFVDGDDWIEPDMYAVLYENSVTYGAELSACGFIKVTNYNDIQFCSPNVAPICYPPTEALEAMFRPHHMHYSACNKLFARSLFKTIRYPVGRIMEDKATTYQLIHQSNRIVWCASPKYHYYIRPDSIMHTALSQSPSDLFTVNEELMAFLDANCPHLKFQAGASYAAECLNLLLQMKKFSHGDAAAFSRSLDCIRQNLLNGLLSHNLQIGTKRLLLLAAIWPAIFKK